MIEENVLIKGKVNIGATVSYIDKDKVSPAIIIITGSGEADRDGNISGLKTDIYKDLAELFVSFGCVVIRYDKRGVNESEGDYSTIGPSDLVKDASSVLMYAKTLKFVDKTKVIVCGHSEGAMIATILAGSEKTAGLLLLSGAGVCLHDVQLYQNRLISQGAKKIKGLRGIGLRFQTSQKRADANLKRLYEKCASAKGDTITLDKTDLNAKWIREHGLYSSDDYVNMLIKYKKPVLAITGTADVVMDYKIHDNLANVPNVEVYTPMSVNYILREIDDDNNIFNSLAQYSRLSNQPIHSGTKNIMKEWISKNFIY